VKGEVPPVTVIEIEPLLPPFVVTFVTILVIESSAGWLTVNEVVVLQPLASETV